MPPSAGCRAYGSSPTVQHVDLRGLRRLGTRYRWIIDTGLVYAGAGQLASGQSLGFLLAALISAPSMVRAISTLF